MAEIYLTRTLNGLSPADDAARNALRKIKLGQTVKAEILRPRNIRFHRKFFALLQTFWQAAGDYPSVEDVLVELKIRIGLVREVVIRGSGEVVKIPGSISFAEMDNEKFEKFYDRAITELCEMGGGIESDALRNEVLQQLSAA